MDIPKLREKLENNIEKIQSLLHRASSSQVQLNNSKNRKYEEEASSISTTSESFRLSAERREIIDKGSSKQDLLLKEVETFAKTEEAVKNSVEPNDLLETLDRQMEVMENLNERIFDLNGKMLTKQQSLLAQHTSAIQNQTMNQMKQWQDMQIKQIESQNEHLIKLYSSVNNASTIKVPIPHPTPEMRESKDSQLKNQLTEIRNDFSKFIKEVEDVRSMIKENAKTKKDKAVSQKAEKLETTLRGAIGEYNQLSQNLGMSPLDLFMPSVESMRAERQFQDEQFREFLTKVHSLISSVGDMDDCQRILEELKERRKRLENRRKDEKVTIKGGVKAGKQFMKLSADMDLDNVLDPEKLQEQFEKTLKSLEYTGNLSTNKPQPVKKEPLKHKVNVGNFSKPSKPEPAPVKRSTSPLKEAIPRFYNVRVSDGPVFLRRTTVRPPSLNFLYKRPQNTSPTKPHPPTNVTVVSRSVSPTRVQFAQNQNIQTDYKESVEEVVQTTEEITETTSTQTIPSEWLQESLLKKLLQRKKANIDRSSSTSDLKPIPLDGMARDEANDIIENVINKELRLLIINLLGEEHFKDGTARVIVQDLVDEVVKEFIDADIQGELQNIRIARLLANDIIDEVVLAQLSIILSQELFNTEQNEPEVISADEEEPFVQSRQDEEDSIVQIEQVRLTTAAIQTENITTSESASTQLTTLSTLISDGEIFSEMASEGEYVKRVAGGLIEATAFGLVPEHTIVETTPQKPNAKAPESPGEQVALKSPGEVTLSPAMSSDGKPSFNAQSFQIRDQVENISSEKQARNILEQMSEWAASNEELSDMATTVPSTVEEDE